MRSWGCDSVLGHFEDATAQSEGSKMRSGAIPRQWWAILWVVGACARATDGLEPVSGGAGGDTGNGSGGMSSAGTSVGGTLAHAGTTVVAGGSGGNGMVMAFGGTASAGTAHGGTSTAGAGDGFAGSGAGEPGETGGLGGAAGHGGGTAGGGGAAGGGAPNCDPPSGMTCKDAAAYCAGQSYAVGDKVLATCAVNTGGCISGKSWLFTCAKAGCADKAPGTTAGEGYWTITQCQ